MVGGLPKGLRYNSKDSIPDMKKSLFALVALMISAILLVGCQTSMDQANEDIDQTKQALVNGLQINEVRASGAKFIEIYNAGATSVTLSNYKVTYGDSSTGPNVGAACALPGTLAAGAYHQVRTDCTGQTDCTTCAIVYTDVAGTPTRNFYLLNASDNSVFETVVYPNPDGTPAQACTCRYNWQGQYVCSYIVPATGMSWSAMPNGGDCFGVTTPSPNAVNQ